MNGQVIYINAVMPVLLTQAEREYEDAKAFVVKVRKTGHAGDASDEARFRAAMKQQEVARERLMRAMGY